MKFKRGPRGLSNRDEIKAMEMALDYMIERAEEIHSVVACILDVPEGMRPKSADKLIQELSRLLEIIMAAGVIVGE